MKTSNLIATLSSFSKSEMKEFARFLRSPYFTEGKNLRSHLLYEYFCILKEYYPEFSKAGMDKKYLFGKLYKDRTFSNVLMRRLDSDLGKLAVEFLSFEEFSKSPAKKDISIISAFGKRKLDKQFLKKLADAESSLTAEKYDSDYYYNKLHFSLARNSYAYTKDDMLKLYDATSESDNFSKYVFCRGLEIYRNIENDRAMINSSYNSEFFETLLSYVQANEKILKNDDLIAMHYNEIMLNIRKEDKYYYELKNLKKRISGRLNPNTLRNLYITMVNYCIRRTNMGIAGFGKERFELDNEIMEENIHSTGDYFDMNYFLSTVRNAVSLGEFAWSEKFIEKYSEKLEPKHKPFAENYALGVLSYGKKNYGKALEYLSKINIEYSARKQQIKDLMIVIYCETGSFENALNLIDTSKHSLKNDKQIPEERKKTFRKFLTFAGMYIKLKLVPDEFKADSLKEKIANSSHFVYREWLLSKTRELNTAA